jgi:hypothetical protein
MLVMLSLVSVFMAASSRAFLKKIASGAGEFSHCRKRSVGMLSAKAQVAL